MNALGVLTVVLAILFVALTLRSWSRIKKGKILKGGFYAMPASIALLSVFLILLVISNLTTYQRLTQERDIARISIEKISDQNYRVKLDIFDDSNAERSQVYVLQGDEWRLEAKILKWLGWANLIGMDSYYQLDRISGRYRDIEQATIRPASAYQLSKQQRGIDLWKLKALMKSKLPFLDAYFGQAVFLPLHDGAIFTIAVNQSGLIGRPVNDIGQQALEDW